MPGGRAQRGRRSVHTICTVSSPGSGVDEKYPSRRVARLTKASGAFARTHLGSRESSQSQPVDFRGSEFRVSLRTGDRPQLTILEGGCIAFRASCRQVVLGAAEDTCAVDAAVERNERVGGR